jgi:hypothetical protein
VRGDFNQTVSTQIHHHLCLSPATIDRSITPLDRNHGIPKYISEFILTLFRLLEKINVFQKERRAPRRRLSTHTHEKIGNIPLFNFFLPNLTLLFRYDVKAPGIFDVKQVGKTLVNRSTGLSIPPSSARTIH